MEESEEKDCFIERGYQTILAEQVFESNKILFLPTGSGKTFIAIMVLKRLFHLLEPPFSEGGKRAVFLVNTVALVEQQAAVLVRHLAVSKVGQYSGDMQVDFWNKATWNEEFETFQVMVMTAEIFNNLLLKKYISLSDIAVLILDECHHAVEDHPMRQIMRLFEDCPKSQQPRVIGLTATLLNGTPKSVPKVRDKVKELEITLHSTVATVDSWDIVKQFSTKPRERYVTFPNYSGSGKTLFILQKIDELFQLCKQFKFVSESNLPNAVGLEEGFVPMFSGKKNEVPNLLLQVSKQLSWLGPFGCLRTIQAVFVTLRLMQQKMTNKSSHLMIHSLYCDLFSLSRCLLEIMDTGEPEVDKRKAYHFSSPKVKALINLLETHNNECNFQPESAREPLQALIFVEEKMTAKVLSSVLKNVAKENKRYAFIKAAYIVGGSSNPFSETWEGAYSKHTNDKIITRFREKITNVLVSTDVLEEGIDIPACNLVVRFDTANGVRSYIQSKGRARHSTSLFALMVSNDKYSAYVEKIEHFCQIQAELENFLVGHTSERASPSDLELECLYETSVEPYYTPVGSKVTMTSAIQLVNGYCMFLAHDRFCKVFPSWRKKKRNSLVIVAIQLPRLSPLQELVKGRPMENLKLAKRAAALEMCRRLHQMGELNDYLLPNEKFLAAADLKVLLPLWEEEGSDSKSKPGTAKRIRSHSVHIPDCYQDCAPAPGLVYLHHIEISPVYVKPIEHRKSVIYKTFSEKRNFAIISSKPFNNVCQFPVFSKFGEINVRVSAHKIGSISKEEYEAIAQFHWNLFTSIIPMAKNYLVYSKESYLLAPTKLDADGEFVLDWGSIHQEPCSSNNFLNTVVTPIHRGLSSAKEAYFITRICSELNGHSPFPNGSYFSYCDYYSKRHRFTISKPEQHLLEAQPISVISNDLIPRYKTSKEEDESLVHFPMESCKIMCADGCLLLKASLLPSILHRLERFFVANDLREKIANGIGLKDKLLEKKCSVWVGLSGYRDSLQESKVSSPKPKPTVSFVKDSPPPKKTKLSCGKPWSHCEEPKDVEHDFENVTVEEIDNYGKFVRNKFSVRKSPHQISDDTRKIPRLLAGEGAIKLLRDSSDIPHSCHILEAMTAASADDFWNLERLETLGDSFLKFVVSFVLYSRFPDLPEGKLTQVKGQILGNRNLYYCAKDKKLASYLKVKKVVPTEGWIPPSFSIPGEIFEENLMALVRRLDLSQEEQYGGVVKQSSIEALKLKAIFQSLPLTATDHHLPIDLNHHDISDKTVADSVESLIGAYLQVCGPIVAVKFLEYMMVVPKGSKDLLLPTTPTKPAGQLGQPSHLANLSALQDLLGYKFNNINLLVEALTHASTPSASSTYERLEFVGDAVIDFLVTAHIYENCGKLSPGDLTDLRSALVNNITFACLSVRYGFYKFMIHSSPALMDTMDRFLRYQIGRQHIVDEEVLILLEESECRIAETVEVPKALGDVFEALIGAVFVDCGKKFALVWQIIYRLMKNEISTFQSKVPKQVVRRLYETVGQHNISFRNSESSPEMHLEQVHVVLTITLGSEEQSFNGFGSNKSQAKKSAAKLALRHVRAE